MLQSTSLLYGNRSRSQARLQDCQGILSLFGVQVEAMTRLLAQLHCQLLNTHIVINP